MKQYVRYRMDFESGHLRWSGIFAGVAMFLLILQHLGLQSLSGQTGLFLSLWLPVALCLAYTVLLCGVRLNAPGVYAILGAAFCLWLLIDIFCAGNVLRIVFAVVGYLVAGGVLILCTGGYLPGRLPAAVCFGVILGARIMLFDLGRFSGLAWLPELARLSMIAALILLPLGMVPGKMKE